jgi:bifunctional UDP-N-acetylglucosamine pyrophosphorylase/glucosamine-1-phosphate N-acetyltransferase
LAAGRSTRTHPLTVNRPKPLLEVLGRTIVEHNLDQLDGLVEEVVLVVGFKREMIAEQLGSTYGRMKLTYVQQEQQLGTGHALLAARPYLADRFLVMNGDDLYSRADIEVLASCECGILVAEVDDITRFGAVLTSGDRVTRIVEKPPTALTNLANTGAYALHTDVLDFELARSERGEFEIVDFADQLAGEGRLTHVGVSDFWLPVSYPWNYLEANVHLLRRLSESRIDDSAVIEDGVTLKGTVVVGAGSVLRSGTYVEGPVYVGAGCEIGPHAYLRPDTILLDGVRTRAEVVDSVLMRNVTAKHSCYIGHSVFGEGCNIAAGTVTADYRHDAATNWSVVKDRKVDSGRRKLGAFVGDGVRLGIGTLIYPGRKIWPGLTTLPGEVVTADIVG